MDIAVEAFTNLDGTGSVPDDALPREQLAKVLEEVTSAPGFIHYLARVDGEAVGEAAMRIDGDLAQIGAGPIETGSDLIEWVDAAVGRGLGLAQKKS
jgi:hypothetical protein